MKKITDIKSFLENIKDGERVYEFICGINENTPKGRYDFNENIYVNVVSQETKESFDGIFESHRDFIDLHVLVAGEEKIYYGDKNAMVVAKEYDKTGDYELLKGEEYSFVSYEKTQGIEFLVNEPHMAGGSVFSSKKVLKAIIKIKK